MLITELVLSDGAGASVPIKPLAPIIPCLETIIPCLPNVLEIQLVVCDTTTGCKYDDLRDHVHAHASGSKHSSGFAMQRSCIHLDTFLGP